MARAGVITLITKNRKAHGVHESTTDSKRRRRCIVRKVRQSEYYQAENAGYSPEFQFDLAVAGDYHGETSLMFEGREYRIIRTYDTDDGGIEIIAGRKERNEPED